jgi:hypothetical protein
LKRANDVGAKGMEVRMARKLEKGEWQAFLESVSKQLTGKRAEIEVASAKLGDQIEAEWVPILGLAYDPKSDIVEVVLEGLDHMISKPQELYAEESAGQLVILEVVDAAGVHQIMRLKDPLMLSGPAT